MASFSFQSPINAANIVAQWTANAQAELNTGIVYGTDNLPGGETGFSQYMGGTTAGVTSNPILTAGTTITASGFTSTFLNAIQAWSSIRIATFDYVITGGGSQPGFPIANVAYLTNTYSTATPGVAPPPATGDSITQASMTNYFNALINSYTTQVRNSSAGTLVYEVCHSSCHSSCHGSRGRR
jgi:hypothetical protein